MEKSLNNFHFADHSQKQQNVVDSYFSSHDLSWKSCITICTDSAPSVSGSLESIRRTGQAEERWN
jgi:hypothetical protein